jgi:hypothetical protein
MLGKQIGEGLIGKLLQILAPSNVSTCVTVASINSLAFASSFATLSAELLADPSLSLSSPTSRLGRPPQRHGAYAFHLRREILLARHSDPQIYQWRECEYLAQRLTIVARLP